MTHTLKDYSLKQIGPVIDYLVPFVSDVYLFVMMLVRGIVHGVLELLLLLALSVLLELVGNPGDRLAKFQIVVVNKVGFLQLFELIADMLGNIVMRQVAQRPAAHDHEVGHIVRQGPTLGQ